MPEIMQIKSTNQVFLKQEQIFHDLGAPLLKKAFEGFNVTMYAYGQVIIWFGK